MSGIQKKIAAGLLMSAGNLCLFLGKLWVAVSSNSIAIYLDSLNSLADFLLCGAAAFGFWAAARPPTARYPYGMGRAEDISEGVLSVAIVATGLAFAYSSLQRLLYPVPVWFTVRYAVVLVAGTLIKLGMSLALRAANKKIGSDVLRTIAIDGFADSAVSACLVLTFTLTVTLGYAVDAIAGLFAAGVTLWSGARALRGAGGKLLGRRDDALCDEARAILEEADGVAEVTNVQCHGYGARRVFTAEVTLCDNACAESVPAALEKQLSERLGAALYLSIGGTAK